MKRLIFAMLGVAAALSTAAEAQRGRAGPAPHPQPSTLRTAPPVMPAPSLGPSLGFTPPPNFSRSTDTLVAPATTAPQVTATTEPAATTTEVRPPPPPPPDPPPSDWGCSDQDEATACDGLADNMAAAESGGQPAGGGFSWVLIGLGSLAAAAFVGWIYRAGRDY